LRREVAGNLQNFTRTLGTRFGRRIHTSGPGSVKVDACRFVDTIGRHVHPACHAFLLEQTWAEDSFHRSHHAGPTFASSHNSKAIGLGK